MINRNDDLDYYLIIISVLLDSPSPILPSFDPLDIINIGGVVEEEGTSHGGHEVFNYLTRPRYLEMPSRYAASCLGFRSRTHAQISQLYLEQHRIPLLQRGYRAGDR